MVKRLIKWLKLERLDGSRLMWAAAVDDVRTQKTGLQLLGPGA